MDNDYALKVTNLSKTYRIYKTPTDRVKEALSFFKKKQYYIPHKALDNISFEVKKGEILGVLGKNGAGKSTLLKIVASGLYPTSGSVSINGKISLLSLGQGFNRELSGIDNIELSCRVIGLMPDEIAAIKDDIISFAELDKFINFPVKTYSTGMYSRLAFAIAASVNSDILVVDEVLSVGDIKFAHKCYDKIKSFKEAGKTILIVTHDPTAISNLCDRAMWIKDGQIYRIGPASNIANEYYNFMTYNMTLGDKPAAVKKPATKVTTELQATPKLGPGNIKLPWVNLMDAPSIGERTSSIQAACLVEEGNNVLETKLVAGTNYEFYFLLQTGNTIAFPIVSAHIYDSYGNLIFGLNNDLMGKNLEKLNANCIYILKYGFKMPLIKNGSYIFNLGFVDGMYPIQTQHHIIHGVLPFYIQNEQKSAEYFYCPVENISVNINQASDAVKN